MTEIPNIYPYIPIYPTILLNSWWFKDVKNDNLIRDTHLTFARSHQVYILYDLSFEPKIRSLKPPFENLQLYFPFLIACKIQIV